MRARPGPGTQGRRCGPRLGGHGSTRRCERVDNPASACDTPSVSKHAHRAERRWLPMAVAALATVLVTVLVGVQLRASAAEATRTRAAEQAATQEAARQAERDAAERAAAEAAAQEAADQARAATEAGVLTLAWNTASRLATDRLDTATTLLADTEGKVADDGAARHPGRRDHRHPGRPRRRDRAPAGPAGERPERLVRGPGDRGGRGRGGTRLVAGGPGQGRCGAQGQQLEQHLDRSAPARTAAARPRTRRRPPTRRTRCTRRCRPRTATARTATCRGRR